MRQCPVLLVTREQSSNPSRPDSRHYFRLADQPDSDSASARLEPRAKVIVLSLKAPLTMKTLPTTWRVKGAGESEFARRNHRIAVQVTVNDGGYRSPTTATIRTPFRRSSSSPLPHSFDTSRDGPSHFMPCASAIFASTGCLLERVKKSSIWPAGVNPISIRPGFSPT